MIPISPLGRPDLVSCAAEVVRGSCLQSDGVVLNERTCPDSSQSLLWVSVACAKCGEPLEALCPSLQRPMWEAACPQRAWGCGERLSCCFRGSSGSPSQSCCTQTWAGALGRIPHYPAPFSACFPTLPPWFGAAGRMAQQAFTLSTGLSDDLGTPRTQRSTRPWTPFGS